MNQLSLKLLLLPFLAGLAIWMLWPSSEAETTENQAQENSQQTLVSAIQPINEAGALTGGTRLPERQTSAEELRPSEQDEQDFEAATRAIQNGDIAAATELLNKLIERQPGLLEPYINLASAQAASGDLSSARQTLMRGLNANENYGALFENLQQVHSALAADAYQLALSDIDASTKSRTSKPLRLPLVTALNKPITPKITPAEDPNLLAAREQILNLENRLKEQEQKLSTSTAELVARDQSLTSLREQLDTATSSARATDESATVASNRITTLESRLKAAQQQIASMVNKHESEVAELQTKLSQQEAALAKQELLAQESAALREQANQERAAREKQEQELARIERERQAQAKAENERLALLASRANSEETSSAQNESQAIDRVKSWAKAWSNQDVGGYVGHYKENYVPPGSSISHATWLEQRRVRLTNKRFIEVTLSGFDAQMKDGEMVVKFTQRYRSNTMDDTIRKQLTLVSDSGDWSRARIVGEQVLR